MKLLLDTCTFLWVTLGSAELSPSAKLLFEDPDNEVYLSSVSTWEIAVKHALGRLPLPEAPERYIPAQRKRHAISALGLDEESTLYLGRIPPLHRDPFDRMLICQAIVHSMAVLGPDPLIARYPIKTVW